MKSPKISQWWTSGVQMSGILMTILCVQIDFVLSCVKEVSFFSLSLGGVFVFCFMAIQIRCPISYLWIIKDFKKVQMSFVWPLINTNNNNIDSNIWKWMNEYWGNLLKDRFCFKEFSEISYFYGGKPLELCWVSLGMTVSTPRGETHCGSHSVCKQINWQQPVNSEGGCVISQKGHMCSRLALLSSAV